MKALLVRSSFRETIEIVEVKETEKSYMLNGDRFTKQNDVDGCIGMKRSKSSWSGDYYLYNLDSEYAKNKLNALNDKKFMENVKRAAEKKIEEAKTLEGFKKLNEALNLNIEL